MQSKRSQPVRAFTLVELLTVLAIIILLVGILIPAISAVRTQARSSATRAVLTALQTGLEQYKADQQVGGRYVPSASDDGGAGNLSYQIDSPFQNTLQGFPGGYQHITGAGLLVGGLAGFDLLGTPGFRSFDTGDQIWSDDTTDGNLPGGAPGAYALDPATRKPERPRVGPFVDLQNVDVTRWNPNAQAAGGVGSFEIPAELEASKDLGQQPPRRLYPMFLDAFGQPILYYRADPAGNQLADAYAGATSNPNFRGIYHYRDNAPLLNETAYGGGHGPQRPLLLRPASNLREPHNLRWGESWPESLAQAPDPQDDFGSGAARPWWFGEYIRDKNVSARVAPQNAQSYLLISAGADGIFGSGDDVANFDHNGEALTPPN